MHQLPNTPPKWTADWFPEEFKIRKYIFDTWRSVCKSYGFEEYLGPLVESSDIWKAKSGEDVGGTELTQITNKEGKITDLAIRPEMTPTVTRMASRIWKETDKPLKWFSIANFYRNEKPQKGRNREFWQLNCDIFGETSVNSDIEILTLSLELMRAFHAPKESYRLRLNHRSLINAFFEKVLEIPDGEVRVHLMRLLDKYEKLSKNDFIQALEKLGIADGFPAIETFMQVKNIQEIRKNFLLLANDEHFREFEILIESLQSLGYTDEIEFSGSLIRGFDYYDGVIFEMFDANKENPRALFGGGRYNGLADIFGVKEGIPAIGFAPGDETMKLFLEGHGLLEATQNSHSEKYYFPLLDDNLFLENQKIAQVLRLEGKKIHTWLSVKKLQKALKYADKNNYSHVIIFGQEEKQKGIFIVKEMKSGEEKRETL